MRLPWLALNTQYLYLLALLRATTALAAVDWPVLGFTPVVTNTFSRPIGITSAGDGSGRLFVVQQSGIISIIQNGTVPSPPFLNITDRVASSGSEQGLLGVAFPYEFSFNGHFYVDYTSASNNAVVISRFLLSATNANVADPTSEQVVLTIPKPYNNHNGGQLAFGPYGYLFIGVGDGGSEGDPLNYGQNTGSLLGKILRIDVEGGALTYAVPPSNPFVNQPGYAPEIWAYGLRNPWRFSFDSQTADLYIADVGQDSYEEIDFQPADSTGGQNYGWRVMEGPTNYAVPFGFTNFTALTPPVAWYSHASVAPTSGGGAAVIGGYVCHGASPRMDGIYFYGDFLAGWLWGSTRDGTNWVNMPLYTPSSRSFLLSSFGQDEAGELYVADYGQGKIYQVYDTQQVWAPTFSPPSGTVVSNNTPVTLSTLTPSATIYYTTDGTTPTTNSLLYSGPVPVSGGITLQAIAVQTNYANSAVASASYFGGAVAMPDFTPPSGPFTNATSVAMTCATSGATLRYTLNGSTPTTNSPVYTGPILISQPTTLTAVAFRSDLAPSAARSVFYAFVRNDSTVVTTYAGSTVPGFSNAVGALAQFNSPQGICLRAGGQLLVADLGNNVVRQILPGASVQTFAGSGVAGSQNGSATNAQFSAPTGICSDLTGNVFVSDGSCGGWEIRQIDTNGLVGTVASVPSVCGSIGQMAVDPEGNLYAGYGGDLERISPNGQVTVAASLNPSSSSTVGVGLDSLTNLYAVNAGGVWKLAFDGSQVLLAGSSTQAGFSDGPAKLARFQGLSDAAVDAAGNIYLTDATRVRRLSPDGTVSTVAGTGVAGYANGRGTAAQFNGLVGLCLQTNGNLYVCDSGNHCIRKISPDSAGIGIADDWQSLYFGYIGIDPNADPDHDGMSNYEEFWAGTDPLDANSALRFDPSSGPVSGHMQLRWPSVAGKTYLVQYSIDLVSWSNLGDPVPGDGSLLSVLDPAAIAQTGQRFYRIALTGF